jgi:hypothetical protein
VKLISQRANELIPLLESVFADANETDDAFLHRLNKLLRVVLGVVYDEERIGNLPAVAQARAEGHLEDVNSALAGLVDALRRVSSEPKDRSNVSGQALEALDSAQSKLLATIITPHLRDVSSPESHISSRNSDITPGTGLVSNNNPGGEGSFTFKATGLTFHGDGTSVVGSWNRGPGSHDYSWSNIISFWWSCWIV